MSEYYFQISLKGLNSNYYGRDLSRIFHSLHGAIFKEGDGNIGLSFPGWKKSDTHKAELSLGDTILVISPDKDRLIRAQTRYNIDIEIDCPEYVSKDICEVPAGSERAVFARSRVHQRYIRFSKIGDAEGKAKARKRLVEEPFLPSVAVRSKKTDESFLMPIDKRSPESIKQKKDFNSYGLSSGKSVPVFTPA